MAPAIKKPTSAMPAKQTWTSTRHREVSNKVTKTITTKNTTTKHREVSKKVTKTITKSWEDMPEAERRRKIKALIDNIREDEEDEEESTPTERSTYKADVGKPIMSGRRVQEIKAASTLLTPPITPPTSVSPNTRKGGATPKGDLKAKRRAPVKKRSPPKRDVKRFFFI